MSTGKRPLEVETLLERVRTKCPLYNDVFRAMNAVQVAKAATFRSPGAFVLEPVYTAFGSPNGSSNRLIQMVRLEVGVLTGVQGTRDPLAAELALDAADVREQLWDAFLGWAPEGVGTLELQFNVSRPWGFDDNAVLWYLDSFQLTRRLSADLS